MRTTKRRSGPELSASKSHSASIREPRVCENHEPKTLYLIMQVAKCNKAPKERPDRWLSSKFRPDIRVVEFGTEHHGVKDVLMKHHFARKARRIRNCISGIAWASCQLQKHQ